MNGFSDDGDWMSDEPVDIDFSIDAARLEAAMKLNGIATVRELADLAGVSNSTLRGILKGRTPGSNRTLEQLALSLEVPAVFLTTGGLPTVAAVSFRSRDRKRALEHDRFTAFASLLGLFAAFLLGRQAGTMRSDPPSPLLPFPPDGAPEANARLLRQYLAISDETPIADSVALAEQLGVLVSFGPKEVDVIDSFCAWIGARPSIVLNPAYAQKLRRRLDVVHELGHLLMHSQPELSTTARLEEQAFRFALTFLYPPTSRNLERLHNAVMASSHDPLLNIQEEWGISTPAVLQMARRYLKGKALTDARLAKTREFDALDEIDPSTRWDSIAAESPRVLADAAESLELRFGRNVSSLAHEAGLSPRYVRIMTSRTALVE